MLGQPETAARLFAVAEQLREEIGSKMGGADQQEYEACLQLTKSQLDGVAFSALWTEGQAMSTKQAIREALSGIGT
jgi:hypothetical protein